MSHSLLSSVVASQGRQLLRYFSAQLPEPSDAPDLVQEVYLRLLRLERPELIRCPNAYVYRVAASVVREHWLKRRSRGPHVPFEESGTEPESFEHDSAMSPATEDTAMTVERLDQLAALLEPLSPKARAALIWAHRDGHTYEEIGRRLSISKNMVKKYLIQTLAQLRERALVPG